MALAGRSAAISCSVDDASYNAVGDIASVKCSHKGNNIDISVITASYIARQQGLKDMSWSLTGFYKPSDTNGQVVIRTAWKNASALYLTYLPNGSAGVKQPVVVDNFDWDGGADAMVNCQIDCTGNGAATDV